MITLPSLFVVFAILPTITEQTSSAEGMPDWTKCVEETTCFCATPGADKVSLEKTVGSLTGDCEKAGAQNRFFTGDSALFQLLITGEGLGNELMFYRMDQAKFGCKLNSQTGQVELVGDQALVKKHKIALFEDRSRFTQDLALCAFKAERVKLLDDANQIVSSREDQSIRLTNANTGDIKKYDFADNYEKMFIKHPKQIVLKCNPNAFEDKSSLAGYHVLPIMNRDKDILSCEGYPSNYKMKFDFADKVANDMIKLECLKDTTDESYYYFIHEDVTTGPKKIDDVDMHTFYCAAPIGEVCAHPNPPCTRDRKECPHWDGAQPGIPASYTCPDKKWIVNGKYLDMSVENEPTCIADKNVNLNEPAFFFVSSTGVEKKVDAQALCFQDYDCNITRPIYLEESMEFNNGVIKCKNDSITMTIHDLAKNVTQPVRILGCDKTDGVWKNMTLGSLAEPIALGAQLSCPLDKESFAEELTAKHSQAVVYGIIAGSFFGLLFLLLIVAFIVFCYKKKRRVKTLDKDGIRKMDRAERIKHCQEFFPKVLNTTTSTLHHIVDGLIELDVMLDMEIEDPDVWDTVYPFIMRLHGAIGRVEDKLFHLFTRYLYLQAKRIIDKHGWISKTPIRKNSTEGLIRVVAVNLLSYALANPTSGESELLLESGFRKLGFKGKQQYPHCGLLWSLISHPRGRLTKKRDNPKKKRQFKTAKFLKRMIHIAMSNEQGRLYIPPDEIIPSFGTVAQQAAFAYGGAYNMEYHTENCWKFLLNSMSRGTIAVSYFAGICSSLTRFPTQILLLSLEQYPTPKTVKLEQLRKIADDSEWNKYAQLVCRIMLYYGRRLDANRLEERLITYSEEPSATLKELHQSQLDFMAAMEKQVEELREWYAAHTDKDELKTKPDYKGIDTNKPASGKELADPNNKSKSGAAEAKSGSGKSSASDSATPAADSAAPAADGATAPASAPPATA